MKVGDIVIARASVANNERDRPKDYGIVLDYYEDDDGLMHLEVQWKDRKGWRSPFELELISESR